MSETKGPIERIREIADTLAADLGDGNVTKAVEMIEAACDELVAQQRNYVERIQPLVATVSEADEDCIFRTLESIGIVAVDDFAEIGKRLARICAEWMASKQDSTPQPERPSMPIDDLQLTLRSLAEQPKRDTASAAYEHAADFVRMLSSRTLFSDGTVMFPFVPVILPQSIVDDGSTVLAVKIPKPGERYVIGDGTKSRVCTDEKWLSTELRIILSAQPAPQFRAGGYYRTRGGEVVGPLAPNTNQRTATVFPWQVQINGDRKAWTNCGQIRGSSLSDDDILPGEVTVWQPPASLKAGDWRWDGLRLKLGEYEVLHNSQTSCLSDWTDPPKPGRYRVPGGGKVATWEGDA